METRMGLFLQSYMSDKFRSFDRTSFQTGVLTHEAVQEADLPIPKEKYTPKLSVEQKMFKLLDGSIVLGIFHVSETNLENSFV